MEFWGCEYLDVQDIQPFYKVEKNKIYNIPMETLDLIVDPDYINNIIKKDQHYIQSLIVDINKYGLLSSGLILVAPNGIVLKDGNHRYCATKQIGFKTFPVEIRFSDHRIKSWCGSYSNLIMKILELL